MSGKRCRFQLARASAQEAHERRDDEDEEHQTDRAFEEKDERSDDAHAQDGENGKPDDTDYGPPPPVARFRLGLEHSHGRSVAAGGFAACR
jgi:hypothetical protein